MKEKKIKPIKAWGVTEKGVPLTHYCAFYKNRKEVMEYVNAGMWCNECGQTTGMEFDIIPVLIIPLEK